jgi:hypothetical protein
VKFNVLHNPSVGAKMGLAVLTDVVSFIGRKDRCGSMRKIMLVLRISLLVVLIISSGCEVDKSYGQDYKKLYTDERNLALGDHQIGTVSQRIIYPMGSEPEKMLVWTAVYTDAMGQKQWFEFNNRTSFQHALLGESLRLIESRIKEICGNKITEVVEFLGRERFLDLLITQENCLLLPHYVTYASLPSYLLIRVWPKDYAEAEHLAETLSVFEETSFYVMTSDSEGIVVVRGAIQQQRYTDLDLADFPYLP